MRTTRRTFSPILAAIITLLVLTPGAAALEPVKRASDIIDRPDIDLDIAMDPTPVTDGENRVLTLTVTIACSLLGSPGGIDLNLFAWSDRTWATVESNEIRDHIPTDPTFCATQSELTLRYEMLVTSCDVPDGIATIRAPLRVEADWWSTQELEEQLPVHGQEATPGNEVACGHHHHGSHVAH